MKPMDTARRTEMTGSDTWPWNGSRPIGYGWLLRHLAELPLSPAVLNSGLAGIVALVAALAWYTVLHAPAMAGKLLPQ